MTAKFSAKILFAVAERFFWSLKHEWTKHEKYANLEPARLRVFKHIETFCNSVRLHQALGYKKSQRFRNRIRPGPSDVNLVPRRCPKVLGYRIVS